MLYDILCQRPLCGLCGLFCQRPYIVYIIWYIEDPCIVYVICFVKDLIWFIWYAMLETLVWVMWFVLLETFHGLSIFSFGIWWRLLYVGMWYRVLNMWYIVLSMWHMQDLAWLSLDTLMVILWHVRTWIIVRIHVQYIWCSCTSTLILYFIMILSICYCKYL